MHFVRAAVADDRSPSAPAASVASTFVTSEPASTTPPVATSEAASFYAGVVHLEAAVVEGPIDESIYCHACEVYFTATRAEHELGISHMVVTAPPQREVVACVDVGIPSSNAGFRMLRQLGWDPEAQQGLGKRGDGPLAPLAVSRKRDRAGVGAAPAVASVKTRAPSPPPLDEPTRAEIRARRAEQKRRHESLRDEICKDWLDKK